MIKKGWKVVRVILGKNDEVQYWSIYTRKIEGGILRVVWQAPNKTCKRYHFDRWTYPNKNMGPLAVFKTFDDANRWINFAGLHLNCYCEIVPCKYETSYAKALWIKLKGQIYKRSSLPDGTALAKRVKLLRLG